MFELLAAILGALGAACVAVAAVRAVERQDTADGLALAQDQALDLVSAWHVWHCPHCPDTIRSRSLQEVWEESHKHLKLCSFYRSSGSWKAVQRSE